MKITIQHIFIKIRLFRYKTELFYFILKFFNDFFKRLTLLNFKLNQYV
jgi:hypothetical protein